MGLPAATPAKSFTSEDISKRRAIKPEQRSDASPPESEPKPEQSGEVAKQACVAVDPLEVAKQACFAVAPQAAADIVLLPAPKLLRSRR